ncbi:hypothetical protein AA958_03360 [Streptomyces sp. CNQ-509]|uniref:hypothetical protein n=1 Tax=Streptomyces sp. CNQ-509 TaxID=444103 RepID=UPI00062DF71E|nr:hypothetical protein [Streptomyces sp. CNQ-509]AKH81379.1 hypothetical protein AA958_03360 [Streptomyces sp. CNQ-509]
MSGDETVVYAERSWNPLAAKVRLTADGLSLARGSYVRAGDMNLMAMAEAYVRGKWLGGRGTERALARIRNGPGAVPLTRVTGSAQVIRVRQAAAFAGALGELAVELSGGPAEVAAAGRRAEEEGVPLWMARRSAAGPHGGMVTVALDRRLVRADVWAAGVPGTPAVRLRGEAGLTTEEVRTRNPPLTVTVAGRPAVLTVLDSSARGLVARLRTARTQWELEGRDVESSRLLRGGRPVALLTRRRDFEVRYAAVEPLRDVRYESGDPLDAVVAHFFGAVCGAGDENALIRLGTVEPVRDPYGAGGADGAQRGWDTPYSTDLGHSPSGGAGGGWFDGGGHDSGGGGGGDGGG